MEEEQPNTLSQVCYAIEVICSLSNTLALMPSPNAAVDLVAATKVLLPLAEQLLAENREIQKQLQDHEQIISKSILSQIEADNEHSDFDRPTEGTPESPGHSSQEP